MKPIPIEAGRIVVSKAGRDQGRRFVVLEEIDRDFVLVADGKLRTMERPKKKRRKHLKPTLEFAEDAARRLRNGEKIPDHELRAWTSKEEG